MGFSASDVPKAKAFGLGPSDPNVRPAWAGQYQAIWSGLLPTVMSSPPVTALGAAGGASQIASSVLVQWNTPGAFGWAGLTQPVSGGGGVYCFATGYHALTTAPPYAADFDFDSADSTGRFEIRFSGQNAGVRVLVQQPSGQYQYVSQLSTFKPGADGQLYFGLVTLGAPGRYRIRLEFDPNFRFYGLQVAPTDTVRAVAAPAWTDVFFGDSFTEPTISDSGGSHTWDGWVMRLSYLLGTNCIACGSGGTGYLNPGTSPKVRLRDRLADGLTRGGNRFWVALGINDFSYNPGSGIVTAAQIGAEALYCLQQIRAAAPQARINVISPFWRSGFQTYTAGLLAAADAIKAAVDQVPNARYFDVLRLPVTTSLPATTLQADAAAGVTAVSLGVLYPVGTYFQIGTGSNAEVRRVTSTSGAGPYTHNFNSTGGSVLLNSHTTGEAVRVVGPGIYTGSGRQGATQGNGNSDRYTGPDGTHPTVLGMDNICQSIVRLTSEVTP